jgi:hypothetical protein
MRDGDSVLLTRPTGVHLDPNGPLRASVTRVVPLEDGARLELTLVGAGAEASGLLYTSVPWPAPALGSSVTLRIEGAARFPAQGAAGFPASDLS